MKQKDTILIFRMVSEVQWAVSLVVGAPTANKGNPACKGGGGGGGICREQVTMTKLSVYNIVLNIRNASCFS